MSHDAPPTVRAQPAIDDRLVEIIASKADVDQRSVIRRLAGLPVRGRTGNRIDRVIADVLGDRP
jgi:hypothetical protein